MISICEMAISSSKFLLRSRARDWHLHLQVGDKEITAVADIADTLVESFSEISSNKHYSSKFQSHKAHAER